MKSVRRVEADPDGWPTTSRDGANTRFQPRPGLVTSHRVASRRQCKAFTLIELPVVRKRKSKAFTLIELLTVIVIILILFGVSAAVGPGIIMVSAD